MRRTLAWSIVAVALVAGCSGEQPSSEAFCSRLAEQLPLLLAPPPSTAQLGELVARYRDLGALAPLAIQQDWDAVTDLIEASVEVDPHDSAAVERLRVESLATAPAAQRVEAFAREQCGVELDTGSVAQPPSSTSPTTILNGPGSLPQPAP